MLENLSAELIMLIVSLCLLALVVLFSIFVNHRSRSALLCPHCQSVMTQNNPEPDPSEFGFILRVVPQVQYVICPQCGYYQSRWP